MEYRTLFMEFSVDKKVIQRDDFRKVYQIVYKNEEASSFADRVFDAFDRSVVFMGYSTNTTDCHDISEIL
jgi:hypothetical protein